MTEQYETNRIENANTCHLAINARNLIDFLLNSITHQYTFIALIEMRTFRGCKFLENYPIANNLPFIINEPLLIVHR